MSNSELKSAMLRLLSRREYSRLELQQRFARKYPETEIEQVLNSLAEDNYQSDRRFAETYLRQRLMQRYGWQRISYDLKSKGVPGWLQQEVLQEQEVDWFAQAEQAWQRRFHSPPATSDRSQFAKQMRYLLQRGFSHDEATHAIRQAEQAANQEN